MQRCLPGLGIEVDVTRIENERILKVLRNRMRLSNNFLFNYDDGKGRHTDHTDTHSDRKHGHTDVTDNSYYDSIGGGGYAHTDTCSRHTDAHTDHT
ncbi:MAG: hypothetical protein ABIA93_00950 [Candidatus Woesearchaeota archaeon]